MIKIKSALQRFNSHLPSVLTGLATSGVLYVANHVLHVPVLDSSVESALTPYVGVLAAAATHALSDVEAKAEARAEALLVEARAKAAAEAQALIHAVSPKSSLTGDALVDMVTKEVAARLAASPDLKDQIVKVAMGVLSAPEQATVKADVSKVEKVVESAEAVPTIAHAAAAAMAELPRAPRVVALTTDGQVAPVPAPAPVIPAPEVGTNPGPSATLPPSVQP